MTYAPSSTGFSEPARRRTATRDMHIVRTLALATGGLAAASVFDRNDTSAAVWALLLWHAFVWPHVAWAWMRVTAKPLVAYRWSAWLDAGMNGVWIALMQFNMLPSVLFTVTLATAYLAMDGYRMMSKVVILEALVCCISAAMGGFAFAPATDAYEVAASIPHLMVVTLALAIITHGLGERTQARNRSLLAASSIDELSGVLTRRYWEAEVNRSLRSNRCGSAVMLMIDIDHFKFVNDRYGHVVGDAAIRLIGSIIRDSVRDRDCAGRYGGDEFAVVLYGIDMGGAQAVADRIRASVSGLSFDSVPGLRCTLSIGLAGCRPAIGMLSDWVKDADAALYRAKLAGRDRLFAADEA